MQVVRSQGFCTRYKTVRMSYAPAILRDKKQGLAPVSRSYGFTGAEKLKTESEITF
jgi:hypothetical protein